MILYKKIINVMCIMMVLALIVPGASAGILDDINSKIDSFINGRSTEPVDEPRRDSIFNPATIISNQKGVPVQIGFEPVQNMWLLQATVGWTYDTLTMIKLDANTEDNSNKAQKEVKIEMYPMGSYSIAALTKLSDARFNNYYNDGCPSYGCGAGKFNAYKVKGGTWTTTTKYNIKLGNGAWKSVEINPYSDAQISLDNGAYVNNLGILSNGANIPSGDFVIVIDPWGNPHLWSESEYHNAIAWWNSYKMMAIWDGTFNWGDVWSWLIAQNKLPQDEVLSLRSDITSKVYFDCGTGFYNLCYLDQGETYKKIKVTYPLTAMSSFISLNIPGGMADTIIIGIGASKAVILEYSLTEATDKNYAELKVKVQNVGGKDIISVKPDSSYYQFEVVGDNSKLMNKDEIFTFVFKAYALDVSKDCNKCAKYSVLADGTSVKQGDNMGDDSTVGYGTIYDGDAPTATTAKLTVIAYSPDNNILSNAEIYIGDELKGKGKASAVLSKGEYSIYSKDISGFYAPTPDTISMNGMDKTEYLYFKTVPQTAKDTELDFSWMFWIVIGGIIIVLVWKSGYLNAIIMNPTAIIPMVLLIIILYAVYILMAAFTSFFESVPSWLK